MKLCKRCGVMRPLEDYYKTKAKTKDGRKYECRFCHAERVKLWRADDPTGEKKRKHRATNLKNSRGITVEQRRQMLIEQNFACLICDASISDEPDASGKASAKIDHCHESGKIRGLLCNHCNTGLGCFRDNTSFLVKAVSYLSHHS